MQEQLSVLRDRLLGLTAMLNVAQAVLDRSQFMTAATQINAAVVEIHRRAEWRPGEQKRMAGTQAWLVERISDANPPATGSS